MALVVKDRVKETTTTTGTGTINLAGAVSGFQTFVAGVGSTNTTYYAIEDANGTAWEVGLGTVTDASPDTLARTTILANSNGDTDAITLSSGTHTVFATYPAGKAVYLVANGTTSFTLDDIPDVKCGGTDFSRSFLINNPGSTPSTGTLSSAENNVGIGYSALASITSADKSVALGYYALNELTTGANNIAIGYESQRHANDGFSNIALGQYSLMGNSDGTSTTGNSYNIAIGDYTARDITSGDSNIAMGTFALDKVTTGSHNIGLGDYALQRVLDGSYNTAVGRNALQGTADSTGQNYNTAIGASAGYGLTTGDKNIFIGYTAGYAHTSDDSMLYIADNTEANDGTIIKADMSEKHVAIGMADDLFSNSAGDATLQIYPKDAADEAIFVKMPTSHSANLIQIQNSSGTDLFVVDSTGEITTGSISTLAVGDGGTGASTAADARTNLGVDAAGTDNSTDVTLAGSLDYITISGQEITRNAIDLTADVTGTLPVANGGTGLTSIATLLNSNNNIFKTISVSGQDDVVADSATDTLTLAAGSNVTITTAAGTDTITIAATDTNTQLSTEEVQDIVGGMVTGNTETGIAVTYEDGDGTLDFVIGTLNQDTTGNAATATALETARTINGTSFDGTANITITAAGSTLSDTVTVAKGGTGATTLTDGGILLGSGTGAVTAMSVLGDGVIVVGDNSTDPTTITAFTASDGVLKHEVGGLELDISAIAIGDIIAGTGTGSVGIVTSAGHSDGDVLTIQADGTVDWEASSSGGASNITGLSDALVENDSIYLGNDPSSTTSTAERNIAIGTTALDAVTTSDDNIAIGYNTGTAITGGLSSLLNSSKNILIGSYAGENLTTGSSENVFIGYEAGHGLVDSHSKSVVVGYRAGYSSSDDRSSYGYNVHVGHQAGMEANNQYTVHIGPQAGEWNAGNGAVAIGDAALKGSSGTPISTTDTVAIGAGAGSSSTGDKCVYLGHNAGASNTSDKMLFIGWDSPSSSETIIKADMENKHVAVGVADSLTVSAGSPTFQVYTQDAADPAFYAKMAGSHSGNLIEIENNSGTDIFVVNSSGQVSTGTWQGTAIAQAYIANDAINGDKIADDVVDSEHYVAGSIDEEHLNATNSPTDNYLLSYDDSSGGFTWVAAGSGGEANEFSFKTISVSGQDDVVADTTTDTLTLAAGSNVTITTTAASDTVTIAATDTNTMGSGFTVSATTDSNATTITQGDDLMFAAGTGITCETTADGTVTISSTVTDTNTTYTAGDGLGLSGTEFSADLKANGGLVIESTEIAVDLGASSITGTLAIGDGGTGATSASAARTALGVDAAGTDNSTDVTLVTTSHDYLSISSQAITLGQIDIGDDTNLTAGTNISLSGDTLNVDDAFLVNDADDTTTGTITAGGFTTAGTLTVDSVGITAIQTASESFADNDTSLMTSAAIDDRINAAVASEDTLAELNDTNISSAAAGHLIIYDNTASVWDNAALTAGSNISITNGDGSITIAATDTNTTYTKASFDLDHLFTLVGASADTDENLGTFTGSTISDSRTIKQALQDLETELETKGVGDMTGVDLTGGTGISIDSETNTGSGAYSSTITCNLEGTELASTGETGTSKFLRVDGDGTCSWQVPPDTDTTYTKASFDLDHLFTLVGASADTDEHLGTFTGSTIADNQTIKAAIQAVETAVETKGATAGSSSIVTVGALDAGSITSGFGTIATGDTISGTTITASTALKTALIEYTDGDDAITIHDGGSISMAKAVYHPIANAEAEPEDATVNIDLRKANYFDVELNANVTDIDFTHGKVGQRFMIRFEQDASSGPYTIAWDAVTMDFDGGGSAVAVTISWPGGTAPTMTATDDKADTYGFIIRAEGHMDGFVIGQNMPVNDN